MSVSTKRRRSPAIDVHSRASVLSSFASSCLAGPAGAKPRQQASAPAAKQQSFSALRATELLERITCVSTSAGLVAIESLQKALSSRVLTSSQVVTHVLEDDEHAPPLCCLAGLLQHVDLRPSDLPTGDLVVRAYEVISGASRKGCLCVHGCSGALASIVTSLAVAGQSRSRDDVLGVFMQPVLRSGGISPIQGSHQDAFHLCSRVLEILKFADMDEGDRMDLLSSWIESAVKASDTSSSSFSSSPTNEFVWTEELRAIATGEPESRFLTFKECEERTLSVLFGCVSSAMAAKLLCSILSSSLRCGDTAGDNSVATGSINWPRALLLAKRACDSKVWADVDGTERASLDATLHTCLCCPNFARGTQAVACILVVTRYLCFCSRNMDSVDDRERGFRDYERWLSQVAAGASKVGIQSLCACLIGLVPDEPARYLRANERVLFRAPRLRDIVADYISLARTRLADLNTSAETNGLCGIAKSVVKGSTPRTIAEVARFVADFTKGGNAIPSSLVRQMNFHRHNFRSVLLEPLLSPDFTPLQSFLDEHFPGDGMVEFNQQRIAMIKTMAFERKDKAIKTPEAERAIAAIKLRTDKDAENDGSLRGLVAEKQQQPLSRESSIHELVDGLRHALDATSGGACLLSENLTSQPDEKRVASILASKFASASRTDSKEMLLFVDSSLEAILQVLTASSMCRLRSGSDPILGCTEMCSGGHFESAIPWVRTLMVNVLSDLRLARFRRSLQHRVLMLLCLPKPGVPTGNGAALGAFVYVLSSLQNEETLFDLTHVLVEDGSAKVQCIANVIADKLAISDPALLRQSSLYAITFAKLAILETRENEVMQKRQGLLARTADGKENVAPYAEAQSVVEMGQEVPCSQLSGDAPPDLRSRGSERSSVIYLPPGLVQLLRWMMSSCWRLYTLDPWSTSGRRSSTHCATSQDEDANFILKEATKVLRSPVLSSMRLDAALWTDFDVRSGWGSEEHASVVLRRFVSAKGNCHASVIGEVLTAISLRCGNSNCEHLHSSARRAKCLLPAWILLALQSISQEMLISSVVEDEEEMNSPVIEAVNGLLAKQISCCIRDAAVSLVLGVLGHLSGRVYFWRTTHESICKHVSQTLGPSVWPCSQSTTKVIVLAYLSWIDADPCRGTYRSETPMLIVASLALHWNSLQELPKVGLASVSPDDLGTLSSRARALWRAGSVSFGFVAPEDIQGSSYGETFPEADIDFESVQRDPLAFAIVLVYMPYVAHVQDNAYTVQMCIPRLRRILDKLAGLGIHELSTILDIVALLSSILPLSGGFRRDYETLNDSAQWGLETLQEAVCSRVKLCAGVPCKTLCLLDEDLDPNSKASSVLYALGFARNDGQSGALELRCFVNMDRRPDGGPTTSENRKLLSIVSRCRIITALGRLNNCTWSMATRLKDPIRLLSDVLELAILLRRSKRAFACQSARELAEFGAFSTLVPSLEEGIEVTVGRLLRHTGPRDPAKLNPDLHKVDPVLWRRVTCFKPG